ncbi:MAG: hypothetical protein ABMA15_01630 [Vicinamibacterales bacterium]
MSPARLRAFLRGLMEPRTELAIPLAAAALILVLGDVVMMAALSRLAPALHEQAAAVPASTRRWVVGVPSALVYLAVVARRRWRSMFNG